MITEAGSNSFFFLVNAGSGNRHKMLREILTLDEPIGDRPPLLELNIVGFEMIDFEDTGGQIENIQCTYENWPRNTVFFKPNSKYVAIEGTVTIRHYTYYSNKTESRKSLVITISAGARGFPLPPSDTLADGGRITPVINLEILEGNISIDNVTEPSGTVTNIIYRWERKVSNNHGKRFLLQPARPSW
ncbi:MAG: hypothetical protein ACLR8Y_16045 [Alistipes indistinctus]